MSPDIELPNEQVLMLQFWNEQNFGNPAGSAVVGTAVC
jgi:hypothetical protein